MLKNLVAKEKFRGKMLQIWVRGLGGFGQSTFARKQKGVEPIASDASVSSLETFYGTFSHLLVSSYGLGIIFKHWGSEVPLIRLT